MTIAKKEFGQWLGELHPIEPNTIPPMTDPLGKHWEQPDRSEITLDDTHAIMNEAILKKLKDYTRSKPTGCYPGKMWRGKYGDSWWLFWFGYHKDPNYCSNHRREILIVE